MMPPNPNRTIVTFAILLFVVLCDGLVAQQAPQYTQYMYNTQIINAGYMATKEVPHIALLGRTQWTHFDGAPKTGTLSVMTPLGLDQKNAVGLSVLQDEIGPTITSNLSFDYAHSLWVSRKAKISFGLKAGIKMLNVDFSKLNIADPGDIFENNVDNKILPQIGAGVYYHNDKFYIGLSVPTFFQSEHFNLVDESNNGSSLYELDVYDRLHYYLIAGHVLEISDAVKFKPAALTKIVSGSPLQWDISANFLFYERFVVGASYRWSSAYSAMTGFQISDQLFLGFGYDYQATSIEDFSQGSYEVFLNFNLFNKANCECSIKPRFF